MNNKLDKQFDKAVLTKKQEWLKSAYGDAASKTIANLIETDAQFNAARKKYQEQFSVENKALFDEGQSFQNSIKVDAKWFVDALEKSAQDISIFKILTAFAYDKLNNRLDAWNYFKGIYLQASTRGVDYPDLFIENWKSMSYATSANSFARDIFTESDLVKIENLATENDYERIIFTLSLLADPGWLGPYSA